MSNGKTDGRWQTKLPEAGCTIGAPEAGISLAKLHACRAWLCFFQPLNCNTASGRVTTTSSPLDTGDMPEKMPGVRGQSPREPIPKSVDSLVIDIAIRSLAAKRRSPFGCGRRPRWVLSVFHPWLLFIQSPQS